MTIKQEIANFFKANPSHKEKDLYHDCKVTDYEYNLSQSKYNLIIREYESEYKLEKTDNLHPDLQNCLQNKEEIIVYWTAEKLNQSDLFDFKGSDGYYWTILPLKDFSQFSQDAQEWLESQEDYNTKEKRVEIKELEISNEFLEGELNLSDFINLKALDCSNNQLTSLDLTLLRELERINCSNNHLSDFDYSALNPDKLSYLNISDNNLPEQDLAVFTNFTNLETLWIGNGNKEHLTKNIYNRFYGSLEPLKDLSKLEKLYIKNTDINSGLKYLPESIEEIYCSNKEKLESKVKEVEKLLESSDEFFFADNICFKKRKYGNPEEFIKNNYSDKENTKKITFDSNTLELDQGEITINDYPNLEEIIALGNNNTKNIIQVTILNCLQLKEVNITNFVDNQKLEISNCPNLEKLLCGNNKLTELDLSQNKQLTELYCSNNRLTSLNLNNCPNLTVLRCFENQLSTLDLTNCLQLTDIECNQNNLNQLILPEKLDNLQKLYCWGNELTNLDFLSSCNPQKLEMLGLGDNNFTEQDLEIFSSFSELKVLNIGGIIKPSYFIGSLKSLQDLKKLEILTIDATDITHGLEYLPDSLKDVHCAPQRPNARVIDIYEELQPFSGDITKWRKVRLDKKPDLVISPLLPPQLIGENKQKSKFIEVVKKVQRQNRENKLLANISKINYEEIHFNNWPRNNKNDLFSSEQLPTRLYNIKEDKVEETKDSSGIKSYAILSYVWGDPKIKATEEMESYSWWKKDLTVSGNKSLQKAAQTCELLGINHVWIDQLCIKQGNNNESKKDKEQEIPKMRQYYSNAEVTLIALNDEIGEISDIDLMDILRIIVNSEWFERSWTYQEGWLSEQTLFMFDDKLIDGRAIAGTWALNQLGYANEGRYLSRNEFERGTKKIATPVGWVYYREGYDSENDKVEITLTQALQAIKNRKRTVTLDGIYSILGLLPYGEEVKVDYSENNTPEQALKEVMRIVIKNGYAEPLAWHGQSNTSVGLCCLPKIDETGSTSVMGSVGKISSIWKAPTGFIFFEDTNLLNLTNQGIDFTWLMPHYTIYQTNQNTHKLESGFEIEGGLFRKEVTVQPRDTKKEIKISLLGTKETLNLVKEGNILVVLYKEWFGTGKLFALLVKETEQENIYHRLGLVELANSEEIKFVSGGLAKFDKKTIIGTNSQVQYQARIEIPPKGNN